MASLEVSICPLLHLLLAVSVIIFNGKLGLGFKYTCPELGAQRQLRYIEWVGVKIYDFQKVTIFTLFKLYNAGLGVLIPKRYNMLG